MQVVTAEQSAVGVLDTASALIGLKSPEIRAIAIPALIVRFIILVLFLESDSPAKPILLLLFMRPIAERLIIGKTAAAKLWVLDCAGDISISINHLYRASNSNRSAGGIDNDLWIFAHHYRFGLIEIIAQGLRT